jgi:hypothetical protein
MRLLTLIVLSGTLACARPEPAPEPAPPPAPPAAQFMTELAALCGQTFGGRVTANTPETPDDPFVGQALVMHVRTCEPGRILVPFHVGADRSRTWVLTLAGNRLSLEHDHRHADGTPDVLTLYGGDSVADGTATRQEFPVDQFSKDLFTREKREVSNTNVWAMELHPGRMFAYELARPGRLFRVEFDLASPIAAPAD